MRPAALALTALLGIAGAQTLIPLDSRPATSTLPALIAGVGGRSVQVPPPELLGNAQTGADPGKLTEWLNAQPADGPLIVSLDALGYGGLVQSRTSPLTADEVLARLQPVRDWQARTGQPVYAFIVLPREPDATDRARNYAVAQAMLGWAREGVFKELDVTWDDALPGSPSPAEGAQLAKAAPTNVRVLPGADEVLAMLVARALAPEPRTLAVEYSDPKAAQNVIKYEGIPLTQSVQGHAEASGFTVLPSQPEPILTPFGGTGARPEGSPDLTLYVYNGGNPRAAALRVSQLLRRGPLAVADIAQVNQGNVRAWADLYTLRRPQDLASLAAWGTPGNNLGTVLAHAKLLLAGGDAERQQDLIAYEYANDVVYSAEVRPALRKLFPEQELNTPQAQQALFTLAQRFFPLHLGGTYDLADASLPWGRSFEWRFDLDRDDQGAADSGE